MQIACKDKLSVVNDWTYQRVRIIHSITLTERDSQNGSTKIDCVDDVRAQFHGSAYLRILRLRSPFSAYLASAEYLR